MDILLAITSVLAIFVSSYFGSAYSDGASNSEQFRLPVILSPTNYQLVLAPFIYKPQSEFYFSGSVVISVTALKTANTFCIHAYEINLTNGLRIFDTQREKKVPVKSIRFEPRFMWINVSLGQPVQVGRNYTVSVPKFRGRIRSEGDRSGLYAGFSLTNGTEVPYVASQLQAVHARLVFPCFDEPAYKATFDVSIIRHRDFNSVSNAPSKFVETASVSKWFNNFTDLGDFVKESFNRTPVMSTYLVAIFVSKFESISAYDSKGREFRNWAESNLLSLSNQALQSAMSVSTFFEAYLNVSNPLNKTNQIMLNMFGGMENWGLIVYDKTSTLINETLDSAYHRYYLDRLVSHEFAHMWFGNLVTMSWWNDLWLNEGFATYFGTMGVQALAPSCDADSMFLVEKQNEAYEYEDSFIIGRPIRHEVYSNAQIIGLFDKITYNKGGAIVRMIHSCLGNDVFRIGISNYLKKHSYKNVKSSDLYDSLSRQANRSGKYIEVEKILNAWINNIAYPIVTCKRSQTRLQLIQRPFSLSLNASENSSHSSATLNPSTWSIPVTMVTKENVSNLNGSDVSHLVQWMRAESQVFFVNTSTWYLINIRSSGYYRVNYDFENWKAIINQLVDDHTVFTPQDRVKLLSDSFYLTRNGQLSYGVFIRLVEYLRYEMHFAPWVQASKFLHNGLWNPQSSNERKLQSAFSRCLLETVYRSIGVRSLSTNESCVTRLTRKIVANLACNFNLRICQLQARAEFDRFVESNFSADSISPDARATILCEGLKLAPSHVFSKLNRLYKSHLQTPEIPHRSLEFFSDLYFGLLCFKGRYHGLRSKRDLTKAEQPRETAEWHSSRALLLRKAIIRARVNMI